MSTTTVERFLTCFEHQRFAELAELYAEDAVFELHVAGEHDERTGREAILARYAADYDPPPEFLRWEARGAPWGAVVEGDALQGRGVSRSRFRWVHVLTIEDDHIVADTVYCTGAVPADIGSRDRPGRPTGPAPATSRPAAEADERADGGWRRTARRSSI